MAVYSRAVENKPFSFIASMLWTALLSEVIRPKKKALDFKHIFKESIELICNLMYVLFLGFNSFFVVKYHIGLFTFGDTYGKL